MHYGILLALCVLTLVALAAEGWCAEPGGGPAVQPGRRPVRVVLRRQWEPREKAFTFLVPEGWQVEGGMFGVDPNQAGGVGNSIDTKCDLALKRDAAGSVMLRWLPGYNYADFSRAMEFAQTAMMFPPGRNYNGMLVKPMPAVGDFLGELARYLRPTASNARVIQKAEFPEVVAALQRMSQGLNQQLAMLGKPPLGFGAEAVVIEYDENGARYREALFTALCDMRASAAMWSNQFTVALRAPAAEAEQWKPVLDIVRQSIQINPQWLAAYIQKSGERGQMAGEVLRYLQRMDQEIFESRSRTRSQIQEQNYLLLTGQRDYTNPFTGQPERDSADYEHRWTNAQGDRIYTDQPGFDPNADPELNRLEWKRTPAREAGR